MTKPVPGIKIQYLQESQYPVVEGTRCVEVRIPDHDAYMPVLAGLIALATKSFNYLRLDRAHALAVSNQWKSAYLETDWMACMNCEELIDCIQPLLDAQTLQFKQIINFSKYGDQYPPGVPLPPGQRGRDLAAGTNATCNLDITWAQALQIVEYGVQLVRDALDLAESATNDTELLQVISSVPGLDEIGVDAIFGYVELITEGIDDNFEAQVTEAYIQGAACAIFCLAQSDCIITLDMVYGVFFSRVTSHFGGIIPAIGTLVDLFAYLVDQDIDGTIIADALLTVVFGGGALANLFLGDVGTKSLETLLKLAVDDASPDWTTLCDDCPAPPTVINLYFPDTDTTLTFTLGQEYTLESFPVTEEDNRILFTAEGFFKVEVTETTGYNPSPFLQLSNYAYAWEDSGGTTTVFGDGTGDVTPVDMDPDIDVSEFVASNADLGAFTMKVIFSAPDP